MRCVWCAGVVCRVWCGVRDAVAVWNANFFFFDVPNWYPICMVINYLSITH